MTLEDLKTQLNNQPETVQFADIIDLIDTLYDYTPTRFINGTGDSAVINMAGTNVGSCKIFAFAKHQNLSKEATLYCFGTYYRQDVLNNPAGDDHANIRSFIQHGWHGISFDQEALQLKGA